MSTQDAEVGKLLEKLRKNDVNFLADNFDVTAIPTGISSFDSSTGIGGIPRRRVSIFQGKEHSGKTLLALVTIASVQRAGGKAAFIDAEHALTRGFAELLGVDWDELLVIRPKTLNDAYDVARELCKSGLFDVVVFDSAVALPTKDEIDAGASDSTKRAAIAQLHSVELRKFAATLDDRTAFIMINQVRTNPNPPAWMTAVDEYTPGGRALKHYSSLTVDVKQRKAYTKGDERIGQRIGTHIIKNKCAAPFKKAEFDLIYASGLDLTSDLIDTALEKGVVRQSSSWFYVDIIDEESGELIEEMRFAGRMALEEAMKSNIDLISHIQARVLK